jgi:acetyl-CoA C-acetyltransferase
MSSVYICSAKRTPIGKFQGVFKDISAPQLGAVAIRAAVEASGLSPELVEEVIMGQVLTAGVGQAPARQASIYAGLPQHVQALTVSKVCGSGLKAVAVATNAILCGDAQVIVAGGQESMSNAPYLMPGARAGYRMGEKIVSDSMVSDGLWDPYSKVHMGNCAEFCAQEFNFTREEQDAFALESYKRAQEAQDRGLFNKELVSLEVTLNKMKTLIDIDEEPRASDLGRLGSLRPAFDKEGTITAANASKINDGAAALVLASESAVKAHNLSPLARVVSAACHAQDPKWFSTAPSPAMEKALKKANLSVQDIDLFEINEAFAVVTLAAMKHLNISHEKVNIHGGACALGHPIGASGARILTTLVHALRFKKKKYGLATLCIGGGEGIALVVEALSI